MSGAAQTLDVEGGRGTLRIETIVFVLALALVAALAGGAFLLSIGVLDPGEVTGSPELRAWIEERLLPSYQMRVVVGAASLIVGLLSLAGLLHRFSRRSAASGERAGQHVIERDDHGIVVASSDSVASVALHAVRRVAGVTDAEIRVRGRGTSPITLQVRAWSYPDADLKSIGGQVQSAAGAAVRRLIGIEVQRVTVSLDTARPGELAEIEVW